MLREVVWMTAEEKVDELLAQFDLAAGGLLKGNPRSTEGVWSHDKT
jgi:hypothetical protein